MEKKVTQHNLFRIILALVFICFGIVALGNNIGWWNIDDLFLEWWPLILVLLGFITIFAQGGSFGGGVFMIFLGVLFLLHTHNIYDISDLIWPAMLILVGVIVWPRKKQISNPDASGGVHVNSADHVFNINTLFNRQHEIINDKQLAGGHGTAVFGNLTIDLREAIPKTGAYIEISAIFGDVSLAIPLNWNVTKHGGSVFGKVEDRRKFISEPSAAYSVTIEMNAVFGHVELTN